MALRLRGGGGSEPWHLYLFDKLFSWAIKADILQRAVMRMVIRMIDDDVCGSPSAPLQ